MQSDKTAERPVETLARLLDEAGAVLTLPSPMVREMFAAKDAEAEALADLVRHMWIHDGYRHNGYLQMTMAQKRLYCTTVGMDFTPLVPVMPVMPETITPKGDERG